MRKKSIEWIIRLLAAAMMISLCTPSICQAEGKELSGWVTENGKKYWYENGVRQGYDPNDPAYRGKEIFDSGSQSWYWLDNAHQGAMATDMDVYQESSAGQWAACFVEGKPQESTGKWVRYDAEGHMVKGWDTNNEGIYYFDPIYGTMAKGYVTIDGKEYHFDEVTGILDREMGEVPVTNGWKKVDGRQFWYENGVRQGYSIDASYRGKEIYDPETDAWYWLDNVDDGCKAVNKDVFQESIADDEGNIGKWVRYDSEGHMVKGWDINEEGIYYYFDPVYGTMAKGNCEIEGKLFVFDEINGQLQQPEQISDQEVSDDLDLRPETVYKKMIAMKKSYPEGTPWTNDNFYWWHGGIYSGGGGCAGFAFLLSDQAFGDLPARMCDDFSQIRVGDILRLNNNTHSVIVLEVKEDGVIVAEGNYNSSIHWGRKISTQELQEGITYVMTRYPEDM